MKKTSKNILYLVLTIIVVTILTGVFVKNKNSSIRKQEEKNADQLTQTTSANSYIGVTTHLSEVNQETQKLLSFKTTIASAITEMGVETSKEATADTMANNIRSITTTPSIALLKKGTYTVPDELNGKQCMVITSCYSSSSSEPASMTQTLTGLTNSTKLTLCSYEYNKTYVYYGTLVAGGTIKVTNTSTRDRSAATVCTYSIL